MQATDWLATRHRDVLAVFDELDYSDDLIERTRLIGRGAELLKLHRALTEDVFYPAVRDGNRRAVDDALAAQRAIGALLDEVVGAPTMANVKRLRGLIAHHLADEETQLFPLARGLTEAAGDRLAEELARYARLAEDEGFAVEEAGCDVANAHPDRTPRGHR